MPFPLEPHLHLACSLEFSFDFSHGSLLQQLRLPSPPHRVNNFLCLTLHFLLATWLFYFVMKTRAFVSTSNLTNAPCPVPWCVPTHVFTVFPQIVCFPYRSDLFPNSSRLILVPSPPPPPVIVEPLFSSDSFSGPLFFRPPIPWPFHDPF